LIPELHVCSLMNPLVLFPLLFIHRNRLFVGMLLMDDPKYWKHAEKLRNGTSINLRPEY
jgi:hypothetical protein